jgi:CheY-like chemotaxis protein
VSTAAASECFVLLITKNIILREKALADPCDVLIADDDRLVNFVVKEWVENTGRKALTAENAIQALTMLRDNPDIRVLVTDLHLPVIDGNSLIREALKLRPNLKVIVITGYVNDLTVPGKYPIIAKPFYPADLAGALDDVCANGCPF